MRIKSRRTLSILISLAMISLFAAMYFALNSNLFSASAAAAPPKITSADNFTCTTGTGGSFILTATPATATDLKWSLTGAVPSGVAVATNTNLLNVAATVLDGLYNFQIKVTNSAGVSDIQNFRLTVNPRSAVSTSSDSGGYTTSSASAVYIYTVRFNAKGGSAVAPQYIRPGQKVNEPEDPTKKNLKFGGWYTDLMFKTEYDFELTVTSDLTLYAKWTDGTEKEDEPEEITTEEDEPEEPDDTQSLFTDVDRTDWFGGAVAYVKEKGLMVGMGDGSFAPQTGVSRAMIVTILYRLAGEPDVSDLPNLFDDVEDGQWYADAVKWAASEEIVLGYDDGSFRPDVLVTKEQLATLIYRVQQVSGKKPNDILMDKEWPDWDDISGWAKNPVNVLTIQGLFRDIPGIYFNPQAPATRAETASILYRYLTAVE